MVFTILYTINKREIQTVQFANKVTLSRHMMVIWQGTELGSRDRRTTTRLTDDEKLLYIDHTFTNHDQSTKIDTLEYPTIYLTWSLAVDGWFG